MISSKFIRYIHTNNFLWQASDKSLLAKLRKKTGYTFSNCKKALELHQNDLDKAEVWLKEQAQSLGWAKADKLQGRSTTQGLIAVIVDKCNGALIELNCETDFVARNKQFHGLADTIATAVLNHSLTLPHDGDVSKILLDSEILKQIPTYDGKTIADHSALTIGTVGENIAIKRALCMSVSSDVKLIGCTHPTPINPLPVSFGKYGSLVAYKSAEPNEQLGIQFCQHIIGMNPTKIGDPNADNPNTNAEDENVMIYQNFLFEPKLTIRELLIDSQAEILDFARFEMGEVTEVKEDLKEAQTCG
ncbi:elongation factor Ts, mitochondrial [Leptopilina boulardi]|uniref:elongation factor Ts, mitochondrial n=1 Tax=Leptopilina boulardi TaxID=63433 RepID=UPI0021F5334C|nr:elongation factor Ts, mitochondrial [Leptopilina boulardi]XP_051168787.1 elongation factor Ts, mitochondrial [Leptopilina boulardi]